MQTSRGLQQRVTGERGFPVGRIRHTMTLAAGSADTLEMFVR